MSTIKNNISTFFYQKFCEVLNYFKHTHVIHIIIYAPARNINNYFRNLYIATTKKLLQMVTVCYMSLQICQQNHHNFHTGENLFPYGRKIPYGRE